MEVCSLLDFILFGDDGREFDVVSIDIKLAVPLTEEQINRLGAFKRAGSTLNLYFSDEDEMPLELVAADCAYTLEGDVIKVALPKEKHLLCVSNEYYVLVLSVPKTKADSSSGCRGIGAGAGVLLLALPLICARLRKRG